MPYESLRDFLSRLEAAGQLRRVSVPVDPHLEMTESWLADEVANLSVRN